MITVEEKNRGESGDYDSWQITYVVIGTDGDSELTPQECRDAAVAESPDNVGEIWRQNANLDEYIATPNSTIAFVTVSYGVPEGEALGGGTTGDATFEFRYQAESEHIYRALATRAYTVASGGSDDTTLAGKIHPHIKLARRDDGRYLPEGIDLPPASPTHVLRRNVPLGFVSSQYQALVDSLRGGVNATQYKGAPSGTVRFVSCDSQTLGSNRGTTMVWGFQVAANIQETVAGIQFTKGGHEVAWDFIKGEKLAGDGVNLLVPDINAIIVQQVFPLVELNDLGA